MGDEVDVLGDTAESGIRVGPYRLIARLGAGGMGEVWRAHDEILHRDIAIKVLAASRAGDADSRARMLREARAQAALNHPNICTIYQAGEGTEGVWIAMERLPGPTLAELASKGDLEMGRVARWGQQIAEALTAAHAVGLAHRDLKPSNAMLAAGGEVKLLDFGLAKRLVPRDHELRSVLTEDGQVLGTPRYMSPEQAAGEPVGTPSDVFWLGGILFELIARRPPFVAATPVEVMAMIIRDDAPELATIAPSTPVELAAIVQACLARDPAKRPTAPEVAARLAAFTATGTMPMVARPRRRFPWLALGLAGVLATGAVVFVLSRGESPSAPVAVVHDAAVVDAPTPTVLVGEGLVRSAAFSADGRSLLYLAERRLWISSDGAAPEVISLPAEPTLVACCVNGKLWVFAKQGYLIDAGTRTAEPTAATIFGSPDGKRSVALDLHELGLESPDGAALGPPLVTTTSEEFLGAARWSPDGSRLAWLRTKAGSIQVEMSDLSGAAHRKLVTLGHASQGPSEGLAWRDDRHLVAVHHQGRDSLLVEIDVLAQPPKPRVLAKWLGRTIDLLAVHADRVAVTETGIKLEVVIGAFEGGELRWSPVPDLFPPGAWARDGRVVAHVFNATAKTTDLVLASRTGKPVTLVAGSPGHDLFVAATTDAAVLYVRLSAATSAGELWRTDFSGATPTLLGPFDLDDSIACGSDRCAILHREGLTGQLRELDPTSGQRGKVMLETRMEAGGTRDIGASPDGDRYAVPVEKEVVVVDRRSVKPRRVAVENTEFLMSVDLTADPAVVFVADAHRPDGHAVSRITGSRTEVLATDATYFGLKVHSDGKQLLATRERTPGGLWVEIVRP